MAAYLDFGRGASQHGVVNAPSFGDCAHRLIRRFRDGSASRFLDLNDILQIRLESRKSEAGSDFEFLGATVNFSGNRSDATPSELAHTLSERVDDALKVDVGSIAHI